MRGRSAPSKTKRKIDALIEEHVFGNKGPWDLDWTETSYDEKGKAKPWLPNHSETHDRAFAVLAKMEERYHWDYRINYWAGTYTIGIGMAHTADVEAVYKCSLPEAICRHVLVTLGVLPMPDGGRWNGPDKGIKVEVQK